MAQEEDPFDKLLFLEVDLIDRGIEHGRVDGINQGFSEGKRLVRNNLLLTLCKSTYKHSCILQGVTKGSEIGAELGFYAGCVAFWLALGSRRPEKLPAR